MALEDAAIRARVRQAREQAGLTQEQAADLFEVHKRTVENWENRYAPLSRIPQVARIYNVNEEWLLHGDQVERRDIIDAERDALLDEVREVRKELSRVLRLLEELREGD